MEVSSIQQQDIRHTTSQIQQQAMVDPRHINYLRHLAKAQSVYLATMYQILQYIVARITRSSSIQSQDIPDPLAYSSKIQQILYIYMHTHTYRYIYASVYRNYIQDVYRSDNVAYLTTKYTSIYLSSYYYAYSASFCILHTRKSSA